MVKYTNPELAKLVREKNKTLNNGRGSKVLEMVVFYLEHGDLIGAQDKCDFDYDKLRQYDLGKWLREVGLLSQKCIDRLDKWDAG